LRLVLADDAALIRDGLGELLPAHGIEVAAVAAAVADADPLLEAVDRTQPDLALIDSRMPPTYTSEGITAAAAITDRHPHVA
jgi:DNA-binding NarL/FixJ family response regulator